MNVLSLFDGMSCGRVALERCGFKINKYYASEIDKYAITVAANNYLDTIHVGDVTKVRAKDLEPIDLVIGGSPCQGFSFAGKQLNFEDPRSELFFEFVRLVKECKPKYFFLENVVMKKEYQDVISSYLGVQPIMLNSAQVSAQSRKRLYWTNIPGYTPPEDKGILLKDIVHEHTDIGVKAGRYGKNLKDFDSPKAGCLMARDYKGFGNQVQTGIFTQLAQYIVPFDKTLQILDKEVARGKVGYFRKDSQANRVYYIHDKAVTLCGDAGGGAAKMGQYLFGEISREVHQVSECKKAGGQPRMQDRVYNIYGISPALTGFCDRLNIAVPGKNSFNDGTKFYTLTAQDRHGILIEGYIRKLTPIECERLQTLPDNYTIGVSNSQRYKMLGNGWTVDAVCEFFKHLPFELTDEMMENLFY